MTERFISNEERDSGIPSDVVSTIDAARLVRDLETRYALDDVLVKAARALRQKYGSAAKHSYAWHKLAGSSVEHGDDAVEPDLVREIDDEVARFVRETLAPLLPQ